MDMQFLSARALTFTPSIIQETSRLAEKCGAINLAEGFPDFPAPTWIKEAGTDAIHRDFNQYRHVPQLCELIAERFSARHANVCEAIHIDAATPEHVHIDPATEVVITCGQTEAMAAAVLAVIDPGDEVVLFNPTYETYPANVAMAGGVARYVDLYPPDWSFREEELLAAVGPKCKAIVVNSPHNPTGKVFTDAELAIIARICVKKNLLALTDEVYEELTYDGVMHRSLASFPGMRARTVVTSSLSKTFSVTGWRIGWATAPPAIAAAIGNIHVKLTDSAPAPFQEAAVTALQSDVTFYRTLRENYQKRRDVICDALEAAGFELGSRPRGGFFVFAGIPQRFRGEHDDVAFVSTLIEKAGVAMVPGSIFFYGSSRTGSDATRCTGTKGAGLVISDGDPGDPHVSTSTAFPFEDQANGSKHSSNGNIMSCSTDYVRVAICKRLETLEAAGRALEKFMGSQNEAGY